MKPKSMRICSRCKERKECPGYYLCYGCLAARKAEWRAKNPERTRAQRSKDWLKRKARLLAIAELETTNPDNLKRENEK